MVRVLQCGTSHRESLTVLLLCGVYVLITNGCLARHPIPVPRTASVTDYDPYSDKRPRPLDAALFKAIWYDNLAEAKKLLKQGADPNLVFTTYQMPDLSNYEANTPLRLAAKRGYSRLIDPLVRAGAEVDYCVGGGEWLSALEIAAENGRVATVKALLKNGANVNLVTPGGDTALIRACQGRLIYPKFSRHGLLMPPVDPKQGRRLDKTYEEIVKRLIREGADVNAVNTNSFVSPLSMASMYHHPELVGLLIRAGATNNPTQDILNDLPR